MSTVNFAEEFRQLINRWRRSLVLNRDGVDNRAPLTKQQLVKTLKSVVQVMLGVNLQEIPRTRTAAPSPSSSVATKMKLEQSSKLSGSFRFESLDALTSSSDSSNVTALDLLSSQSKEEMEIIKYDTVELLPEEKKFISRSNPTIHVSFTDKPDTSIREHAKKLHNVMEKQGDNVKSHLLLNKIEVLSKCAADVVAKIDELKKDMCPQTAKPIRQLSSITALPRLSGSSPVLRKVSPPNLRKSSIGFPGTSAAANFSTMVTIEEEKASARRQTIAPGSIHIKPSKIPPTSRSPAVRGSTTKKTPSSTVKRTKRGDSIPRKERKPVAFNFAVE
ncbi:uncharacterized protein LOC143374905 [Andrena cerasifolii]|uniref:uncharacterized protein LOC143374905 n=1 Tax=Andrena cerasifolii TaxID=2819439 RepID=UPI0040377F19